MTALKLAAIAAFGLVLSTRAEAEPNPNTIDQSCRATTSSFVALRQCIDAERRAMNEQGCLDVLASWPEDKPCPTVWFKSVVANMRAGLPCRDHEVRQ